MKIILFRQASDPGPERPSDRLLWSAQYNQLDILRSLITERPDLIQTRDEDGYSPLHRASYSGHVEVGWHYAGFGGFNCF